MKVVIAMVVGVVYSGVGVSGDDSSMVVVMVVVV